MPDDWEMDVWTTSREKCSDHYLGEKVTATAGGASVSTNFTVVKVDVEIAGLDEAEEESAGAYLAYVADTNGVMTAAGTNAMVGVKFTCAPADLPPDEMVTIENKGHGELYMREGEALYLVTSTNIPAREIGGKTFLLHGHTASGEVLKDKITIEHPSSKAKDRAFYTVVEVDLDVDTLNMVGTSRPQRTLEEDLLEEDCAKIIHMNDMDIDGDFIPGYLDGFGSLSLDNGVDKQTENGCNFVQAVLECTPHIGDGFVRFLYECPNRPENTGITSFSGAAAACTNAETCNPLGAGIRIWLKPEASPRNPTDILSGGDFIPPNQLIPIELLGSAYVTLYIEGIGTSPTHAEHITAELLDKSGEHIVAKDVVAYEVIRCVLHIGAYRPYTYERSSKLRYEFFADYSTPRSMISSYCFGAKRPDRKYHESAAFMGHAFARIQSRTPDMDVDIWTGQTGMGDKKGMKDTDKWYYSDVIATAKNGEACWFAFPDGKENGRHDLWEPWRLFLGEMADGYALTASGTRKRLTAISEHRIMPETVGIIRKYREQKHDFSKYGLDATIKETDVRCGCGSYLAILCQYSGLITPTPWIVSGIMPIVPLPSMPDSAVAIALNFRRVIDDCERDFTNDLRTATWSCDTGWLRSLRFADPGLIAKWIDEQNSNDPVVNDIGRNKQSVFLHYETPPASSIKDWER